MFLVPIPQGESFTTLLDFLKSWIKGLFGGSLSYIIVVILIVSAIMSTYDYFAKPEWIRKNHYLTRALPPHRCIWYPRSSELFLQ